MYPKQPSAPIRSIMNLSPSMEQHALHLESTLQKLQDNQFFLKMSKCCFGQLEVNFLGHVISGAGVQVEIDKIKTVQEWPIPTNVKQVRGFLGLTGYYRRFVRNYGIIARPLMVLTKKDGFLWSADALSAFQALKSALTTAPVLHLPDFSQPFVVECDASSTGVGTILSQQEHPIAYFSKGFSSATKFKSAYDRELLALVLAVQKWNHYLMGRHFVIRTDHYTLKFLLEQRITTTEQQRLLLKLMPYDFSIVHRAGKENKGTDALSRRPLCGSLLALTAPICVEVDQIRQALPTDPYASTILQKLRDQPLEMADYHLVDGLLFFKKRLFIPDVSDLRSRLLQSAHDSPIRRHGGYLKTSKRLSSQYFWPHMNKAILGLPMSNKMDTILVVIDHLSKYAHFLCLAHPYTAKSVAALFCKEIIRLHGFPRTIVSDRDVVFISNFWQELFRLSQTKLKLSTSYHPQTDGQSEVLNRCLEAYLRCFAQDQPRKWSYYLPWAEFSYNTSFHSATGTTPFSIVYGRPPPPIIPYVLGDTNNSELEQQLIDRDDMLKLIRNNLAKAQDRMKQQANLHRTNVTFKEGDYVFLRLQPYRQKTLAKRRFEKLSPRFFGPYKVKRVVGPVAYELELPSNARIHPIFHVSLLKQAHGFIPSDSPAPLPITKDFEELLISWSNRPIEEATWECHDLLVGQFPTFRLEDKSFFRGGSIDTLDPKFGKTYTRKVKGGAEERSNVEAQAEMEILFGQQLDPFGQPVVACMGVMGQN
ncbi:hypothetical protein E3N88_26792 [Mikania micrantha]|uniref:Integrase catalytic domain-containing protein n=1 Tax=Mikania micrantha TaxID=192012 RepID=A0A5N6MVH7_9ASTR|nr:hypothetical protein E3N88_26792 [Mikania micrantha]